MRSGLGFSSLAVEVSIAPEDESFANSPYNDTITSPDATEIFGFLKAQDTVQESFLMPPATTTQQLGSRFSTSTYAPNTTCAEDISDDSSSGGDSTGHQLPAVLERGEAARIARIIPPTTAGSFFPTHRPSRTNQSLEAVDLSATPQFTEHHSKPHEAETTNNSDGFTPLPKRRHAFSKSLSQLPALPHHDQHTRPTINTIDSDPRESYIPDREHAVITTAQVFPMTPARAQPLFRPPMGQTPSPTSSAELSPVAKKMMADLRFQRTRAEREKRYGRWGNFTTSKLKN